MNIYYHRNMHKSTDTASQVPGISAVLVQMWKITIDR